MRKALLLLLILAACVGEHTVPGAYRAHTGPIPMHTYEEEGWVMFTITDKAVHPAEVDELTVYVSNLTFAGKTYEIEKEYDLVFLQQDKLALLTQTKLEEGIYENYTLRISGAEIRRGTNIQTAHMPTKEFTFQDPVVVKSQRVTLIAFDMLADESVHVTTEDRPIFAPVIQMKLANEVKPTVASDGMVYIKQELQPQKKYGTDTEGRFGIGNSIWKEASLQIENGKIKQVSAEIPQPVTKEPPKPDYEAEVNLYRNMMNPQKLAVPKGKLVRIMFVSRDEEYGILFEGLGKSVKVNYTDPGILEWTPKEAGVYTVKCSPCAKAQEKVIGQLTIQ